MFADIVIPNNNEAEFIEIASKLGIKKLYFLYDFDDYNEEKTQKKLNSIKLMKIKDFRGPENSKDFLGNHKNINIDIGFLVNQKNLSKASKLSKLLVVKSSDKDRFFIESKKINMIYGFEEINRKDYLHQRASGLNHILCELAKKNNVAVGFSYSSLFNKNGQIASQLIGRMMQNIALCQKYKVKIVIGSFSEKPFDLRAPHDVMSLFAMLGMNGKNVKEYVRTNN